MCKLHDYMKMTWSDALNSSKMDYKQHYTKYEGLNKGFINFNIISFSDLQLSFWFKLRYLTPEQVPLLGSENVT